MVSAYVIFVRNSVSDPDEMARYGELARKVPSQGLTPLARYGKAEALEGDPVDGVVIAKFETMEAAKAWYFSPEYQAALPHRLKGADYRVFLTEGLD